MPFCIYCGRPLKEGEVCPCRSESQPFQQNTMAYNGAGREHVNGQAGAPSRPGASPSFFNRILQCLKAYFGSSAHVLDIASSGRDTGAGFFFAGVQALFTGFFFMALARTMLALAGSALRFAYSFGYSFYGPVNIPYFNIFLFGFIVSAALYFGVCLIGPISGAATGTKAPYTAFLASVGISSIPSAILLVAATLLTLVWVQGGIFLAAAASITWVINAYAATKVTLHLSDSKINIFYGFLMLIIIAVICYIVSRFLPSMF